VKETLGSSRLKIDFKDFSIAIKRIAGKEDYNWLCDWLKKNKEKEIEEAQKKHKRKRADELKKMSTEDYLFSHFNNPDIERQLKKDADQNKPEESERLFFILAKLKLEKLSVDRTLI